MPCGPMRTPPMVLLCNTLVSMDTTCPTTADFKHQLAMSWKTTGPLAHGLPLKFVPASIFVIDGTQVCCIGEVHLDIVI